MYLFQIKNFFEQKLWDKNLTVVPLDMLPKKITLPAGFVINLSTASESGTHWVAVYINARKHGLYFDSYGFEPKSLTIQQFLNKNCVSWSYNRKQLQQIHSRVCGLYAATFLYYITQDVDFEIFLRQFTKNLLINDFIIEKIFVKLNK